MFQSYAQCRSKRYQLRSIECRGGTILPSVRMLLRFLSILSVIRALTGEPSSASPTTTIPASRYPGRSLANAHTACLDSFKGTADDRFFELDARTLARCDQLAELLVAQRQPLVVAEPHVAASSIIATVAALGRFVDVRSDLALGTGNQDLQCGSPESAPALRPTARFDESACRAPSAPGSRRPSCPRGFAVACSANCPAAHSAESPCHPVPPSSRTSWSPSVWLSEHYAGSCSRLRVSPGSACRSYSSSVSQRP